MSSVSSSHYDTTTSAPEPAAPPSPPCQAIFHYHTCGCRTTRPVFLCRRPQCSHHDGGPISILIAQAPFACQSSRRAWKRHQSGRVGRRPACAAADPAAARFLREEDTAVALAAADLVELAARAGLDARALDELVPRCVEDHEDWRVVVAERYARLRRSAWAPPASSPPPPCWVVRGTTPDLPRPTAELHAETAPARDTPSPCVWPVGPAQPSQLLIPGLGLPSLPAAAAAASGPSELAADDAWPPYRAAPNGDNQSFAAYHGARLGNSESVLAWLATADEPVVVAADESPLRSLLRDSEPLPPSRAAPSSSLDPESPHDQIRRTPRGPGARVDESAGWLLGAQDPGSDGASSQSQKSLFGRGIFTYFNGGLL